MKYNAEETFSMTKLAVKALAFMTFLNLSIFSAAAYHDEQQTSGTAISIPSYSEPVDFLIFLALPAFLGFLAIQQPIEKKLEGKWRRDEPARKYSSIIAIIAIGASIISPVFHEIPSLDTPIYLGALLILGGVALTANKWDSIESRLPV